MRSIDLLVDAFGRIQQQVHAVVDGLGPEDLSFRVDRDANSIAWLVWHLTRVQDDHVADVAATEQVWTSAGWSDAFGLPFDVSATGFGHSADEVAAVRVRSGGQLVGYHDAVHEATTRYLRGLQERDLERIVDSAWDPPVSLGVRLISVVSDDLQHVGQAAIIRGVVERLP